MSETNSDYNPTILMNSTILTPNPENIMIVAKGVDHKDRVSGEGSQQKMHSVYSPNQSASGMVSKFYESPV